MKKIIGGASLFLIGFIVPAAGMLTVAGLAVLSWGLLDKARESKDSNHVDIAPLANTDDLNVFQLTGTVVGIQSRTVINNSSHTTTTGGGGYLYQGTGTVFAPQTHTSSSTSSLEVVRYFVKDAVGEFTFELNNPPLAVREGHRLSTVYAGNRATSTQGWLVAAVNHGTGKHYMLPYSTGVEKLVKRETRIPGWLLLGLPVGVFFLGLVLIGGSEVYSLDGFVLLVSAAVLVFGIVKNHRAGTREDLTRDVIVTSIRSKILEVIADEASAKLDVTLREYEKSPG